jgi:dTDP-4-amino-4,6-dideoxygalactose transaminase
MKIPLVDLKAQYLSIKKEIDSAIKNIILQSAFIHGEELELFEKEFAKFCRVKYGVGVASGSVALDLALMALGVGPGDEVILPSHTFIATAEAVSHVGAKPVFVDIDEKTYNINPSLIEKAITKKTKAIIPVHLYGQPAEMEQILKIAKKYKIKVLEDAAQAHGAEYKGKKVGSFGEAAIFSFFPAKVLGCYGDAGMVVTNNQKIAERILLLRDHGRTEKYVHKILGYGLRMDNLQAAILRVKLRYIDKWIRKRRQIVKLYNKLLVGSPIITPYESNYVKSVYYVYTIRIKNRDKIQEELKKAGIGTGIYYPIPLHLQPAYKHLGYKKGDLPVTEKVCQEILSLPLYPELKKSELGRIVREIKKILKE